MGLMASTSASPASMSTPAARYVSTSAAPRAGAPDATAEYGPTSPARNMAMARTKASPSSACTLVLSVSAVSPATTGHSLWTTMGPPSTCSVTKCTVYPDLVRPAAITASWTARSMPPAKSGSSDGCTFMHRSAQRSVKAADTMRM